MQSVFPTTPLSFKLASSTYVLKHLWFILFNHPLFGQVGVKISKFVCTASWHTVSFQRLGKDVSLFSSFDHFIYNFAPRQFIATRFVCLLFPLLVLSDKPGNALASLLLYAPSERQDENSVLHSSPYVKAERSC